MDVLVPLEQDGTTATVRAWLRRVGETVAQDDPLVELETDKVTQEVGAPAAGVLTEILLDTDAQAVPGAVLGRIAAAGEDDGARGDGEADVAAGGWFAPPGEVDRGAPETALSPAVRRAVREHGIDPSGIAGTGRGGRVTRADVDHAVAEREAGRGRGPAAIEKPPAPAAPAPATTQVPPPAAPAPAGVRVVPHDRMRLAIAQAMLQSVTTAPHVTAVFECDMGAVMAHRQRHSAAFERAGAGLTLTAYMVAASVQAMRAAPAINGRWFADRLEIPDEVGVGIGTALGERGLVVPVVARAQELSLLGIAARLTDLTARARDGRLTPSDMQGGTFTISNHGVSGSLLAAPVIIRQPQSAILGVGRVEKRVVVREVDGHDTIQIRPMCYVSLTIDHRVVDGHATNAWLARFVAVLEGWPAEE